jgi:hypothetical protein
MLARFGASSRSSRAHPARAERPRATALALAVALVAIARPAPAEPVRVRFPEGPPHGFVDLTGPRIAQ